MKSTLRNFCLLLGAAMVAVVLTGNQAHAQLSTARAGIKGGLNVSNFYTKNVDNNDARLGFHAGVYGQIISSEAFALQVELNYSTKGIKSVTDGFIDQETDFNLNYLDLPVLAVFKLGDAVELHAGVYGAYLLNAKIKSEGDLGDSFDNLDKDNFEAFDFGLAGGIGFNFGAGQIGARYNLGLTEIAKSNSARNILGDSKNSVGQIYLAFNLNQP